jgi:hypothetical protein
MVLDELRDGVRVAAARRAQQVLGLVAQLVEVGFDG